MVGVVQEITVVPVLLVIAAVGIVVFNVVIMLEVAVQPFYAVTVTVYVPAAAIEAVAAVPSVPLHK